MSPQIEILCISAVVASACVIPGVFLVLRGVSLMSDAISHAILLGIVLMFFWVGSLDSPFLIVGASLAGVVMVSLTELLIKTKRINKDAAIGLVFPVFFSLGVILITQFAGDIHLDTDAVLLGELAFAPFHRAVFFGISLPVSLVTMGVILILNLLLLGMTYKELKVATFDPGLSVSLGISPVLIHYGLMLVTSITAVGAFDAVGSILVVALMITPPASAFLIVRRLSHMIFLSIGFGLLAAIGGYGVAHILDASIAGSMASVAGLVFILALFFSPSQGLVAKVLLFRNNRLRFSCHLLMVQLLAHEKTEKEEDENTIQNMVDHMGWGVGFARQVAKFGVQEKLIIRRGDFLALSSLGRETARSVMVS